MNEKEIQNQALALKAEADSFQITNQESYNLANEFGRRIKQGMRTIDAYCDPVIDAAHKAHKAACDQKRALYAPFEAAKIIVDQKQIMWWRAEQERVAEERRKAEDKAHKKAEDERLQQAQELQDAGMTEAAEDALKQPIVTEKVTIAEPEKAGGESYRETWKAEVMDLMALVKAVAQGLQPLAYLEANTATLNRAAAMFKGTLQIQGVKITSGTILARRMA